MPGQILGHICSVWKHTRTHMHAHVKCRVSCLLVVQLPCLSVCQSVCVPTSWPLTGRQLEQRALPVRARERKREEGNNIFVVVAVVVVVSVVVAVCLLCSRMHPASGLMCCLWWPTTATKTATKVRVLWQTAGWSISIRSFIFSALSVSDWQTLQQIHLYLCIYKMQLQVSSLLPSLIRFISADAFNQIQLYLFVSFPSADNVSQQQ